MVRLAVSPAFRVRGASTQSTSPSPALDTFSSSPVPQRAESAVSFRSSQNRSDGPASESATNASVARAERLSPAVNASVIRTSIVYRAIRSSVRSSSALCARSRAARREHGQAGHGQGGACEDGEVASVPHDVPPVLLEPRTPDGLGSGSTGRMA